MCKLLAELLGTDKQLLRETIDRLEYSSGEPGVDVRLTSEICVKAHMKMRELGLDPHDTTAPELYQALLNLTAVHDKFLADKLGIQPISDSTKVYAAVAKFMTKMDIPKQVWALKHVSAKRLLKSIPPKVLMKALHYRSVDSMLKREPATALLTVAHCLEQPSWQHRFTDAYKRLKSTDFEVRDIEISYHGSKGWKGVAALLSDRKHSTIVHSPEMGAIVLMPILYETKGLTLSSLLAVIHCINETKVYDTFTKLHHLRANYGRFFTQQSLKRHTARTSIAGQPIHWRIIHRYFGSQPREAHPQLFEPHVHPDDWAYRKAEHILYHIEPALHFWHDLDFVGLSQVDAQPISFNLTDVVHNLIGHQPFAKRTSRHLRDSLWNELYVRYIGQASFEQQVLAQLDEAVMPTTTVVNELGMAW